MCHKFMMQKSPDHNTDDSIDSQEMEIDSQRGNKSSTKSPRRSRWSRSSSKKGTSLKRSFFSFQPFHSKEQVELGPVEGSKSGSLKENAVRSKSTKHRPTTSTENEKSTRRTLSKIQTQQNISLSKPSLTQRTERTLLEKSEQNIIVNTTPKRGTSKQIHTIPESSGTSLEPVHPKEELPTTILQVSLSNKQNKSPQKITFQESVYDGDEVVNIEQKSETLLVEINTVHETVVNDSENIQIDGEKQLAAPMPLKFQGKGRKKDSKSPILKTKQYQHKLKRSFSDPTRSPRKDEETRVLFERKYQMHSATVAQASSFQKPRRPRNYSVDSYDPSEAKDIADIETWKREIKNSPSIFSDATNDEIIGKIKYRNSCIEDYYPLLKTKIPEEDVKEDGSISLTRADTSETNRDSGVVVDAIPSKTGLCNNASDDSEIESKVGALNSTCGDEGDFDTLKHKKVTLKDEVEDNVDDSTLTRSSQKSKETEEEPEWDMYALLKKFESVEWDLTPASMLKKQTLDLDDCNLDSVPAAVTEIEYYAFRDVEAVSLNNNSKIENADILGKLTDLRVINMWGCNLKEIPKSWSALKKLMMLGLGGNRELTIFSPLKHLTNLVWLDLGGCGLTKIPDEVTNMMKLKVLALGGNPGIEIGDEICSLWDLKQLGLNGCELECIPKAVFSLTKLTHLHLDNNYICQISQEIVQLTELEELTVTGNSNISFPKILSQCDTIKCIIVDQSKNLSRMSGTLKSRMKQMPRALLPATNTSATTAAET